MKSNRVSVLQAAKELGIAPQGVREYMKRGLLDIGEVRPSIEGDQCRYFIYRDRLDRHLGKVR